MPPSPEYALRHKEPKEGNFAQEKEVPLEADNEQLPPPHSFYLLEKKPADGKILDTAFGFRKALEYQVKNKSGEGRRVYEFWLKKFKQKQEELGIEEQEYTAYKDKKLKEAFELI